MEIDVALDTIIVALAIGASLSLWGSFMHGRRPGDSVETASARYAKSKYFLHTGRLAGLATISAVGLKAGIFAGSLGDGLGWNTSIAALMLVAFASAAVSALLLLRAANRDGWSFRSFVERGASRDSRIKLAGLLLVEASPTEGTPVGELDAVEEAIAKRTKRSQHDDWRTHLE